MHSRIFQLKTRRDFPTLTENMIPDSFEGHADYWCELDEDRAKESINHLCLMFTESGVQIDGDSMTFTEDSIVNFLSRSCEKFKKIIPYIINVTPRQWAGFDKIISPNIWRDEPEETPFDLMMFELKNLYSDEGGYWIVVDDDYPMTLGDFMRRIHWYDSPTFYIGGVLDYHF